MLNKVSLQLKESLDIRETVEIRFYPYAGIRHTVRYREKGYLIRLSDVLNDAPEEVIFSISAHLLFKMKRRKNSQILKPYDDYIRSLELHQIHKELKVQRGRAPAHAPRGAYWNLEEVFGEVNGLYFKGELSPLKLRWSPSPSYRVLGRWEPAHEVITISKALDHPAVPREVMHWIMAHEALHYLIPVEKAKGRYRIHPPEFRKREKALPVYPVAVRWLKTYNLKRLSRSFKNPLLRAIINF